MRVKHEPWPFGRRIQGLGAERPSPRHTANPSATSEGAEGSLGVDLRLSARTSQDETKPPRKASVSPSTKVRGTVEESKKTATTAPMVAQRATDTLHPYGTVEPSILRSRSDVASHICKPDQRISPRKEESRGLASSDSASVQTKYATPEPMIDEASKVRNDTASASSRSNETKSRISNLLEEPLNDCPQMQRRGIQQDTQK